MSAPTIPDCPSSAPRVSPCSVDGVASIADEIDLMVKQLDNLVGLAGHTVVEGEDPAPCVAGVARLLLRRRSDLMRWAKSVRVLETAEASQESP